MTREELLAEAWQLFIRLTDEQVAQLAEFIREECESDEDQTGH